MWWLRIDLQKAIRSELLSNEGSTFSKALRQRRKLYCAVYSFLSKRSCVGVVRSEVCRCRHLGLTPAFWQDFFCVVRTCWVAVDLKEATRSQLLSNWRSNFSKAPSQLSTKNCAVYSVLLGRSCVLFGSNTKRAWWFSLSASHSLLTRGRLGAAEANRSQNSYSAILSHGRICIANSEQIVVREVLAVTNRL